MIILRDNNSDGFIPVTLIVVIAMLKEITML